jgi:hypothetical protein
MPLHAPEASWLGKRDLRDGAQVGDEDADFVLFEGFEQAFGHHGDGRILAGEDFGFRDEAVLTDERERELLVVFRSESGVIATRSGGSSVRTSLLRTTSAVSRQRNNGV